MFNPFEKPLREIEKDDLNLLVSKGVVEGVFVEYKQDFVNPLKIARSVASFANTYGGWLIVGAQTDNNNLPIAFPGFDLNTRPKPKEDLRNMILSHVDPFPRYYTQLVEVSPDRGVLLIQIPESDETPHVTSDGRIYRRNAEGSDPVPEKDRFSIDKLYEKGKQFRQRVEKFCQREMIMSEWQAKAQQPWLEMYFLPYPLDQLDIADWPDYAKHLKERFEKPLSVPIPLPTEAEASTEIPQDAVFTLENIIEFNNFFITSQSISMRQTTKKTLSLLPPTFEFYHNGAAKIFISVPLIAQQQINRPLFTSFLEHIDQEDLNLFRFIDGQQLFNACVALIMAYVKLLEEQDWDGQLLAKFRISNSWRSVLFIESKDYIQHVQSYGVPVCHMDRLETDLLPHTMQDIKSLGFFALLGICGQIFSQLGIPFDFIIKFLTEQITKGWDKSHT